MRSGAITLVEILIVLGILAALVVPAYRNVRTDADSVTLSQSLKVVRGTVQQYYIDHNGQYPTR